MVDQRSEEELYEQCVYLPFHLKHPEASPDNRAQKRRNNKLERYWMMPQDTTQN